MIADMEYNERKEWAKNLYLYSGKNTQDIATEVNVDEATIRYWNATEKWDGIKFSLLTSKKTQLENYYLQLERLDAKMKKDEESNPKDIDQFVKFTTAIRSLEGGHVLSDVIEIFEKFTIWLRRKDRTVAKIFITHLNDYISACITS